MSDKIEVTVTETTTKVTEIKVLEDDGLLDAIGDGCEEAIDAVVHVVKSLFQK